MIFLLNIFSFLISLLGFRGIHCVSKFLSVLCFDILRIRRSIILQNLDIVFANTKTLAEKKANCEKFVSKLFFYYSYFFCSKKTFSQSKNQLYQ